MDRNPVKRGLVERPEWKGSSFRAYYYGERGTIRVKSQEWELGIKRGRAQSFAEVTVSDPDSPRYGEYLTSEQFESKYSPTEEDLAAARNYFESEGFTITYLPRNRLFLSAKATAADVERVFATHLGQYEVKGELRHAPMELARMPAAIASRVTAVLGLSIFQELQQPKANEKHDN